MIQLIEHQLPEEAARVYQIFQRSYPFEGRLLGVTDKDFPPLQRSIVDIRRSQTSFYGFFQESLLAGVMELTLSDVVLINSFVVDPNYFKKGIGSKMMQFVFKEFKASQYVVV
jgi:predicted GNAT family acetyltransferase